MLPGFRFLFAAIVLSMSILVFGLGAAALLHAAHEQFASNTSLRTAPETTFAQPSEATRPVLAVLRVEPPAPAERPDAVDPPAAVVPADTAATSAPAEPESIVSAPPEPEKIAALTAQGSSPSASPPPPAKAETPADVGPAATEVPATATATAPMANEASPAQADAAPTAAPAASEAKVVATAEPAPPANAPASAASAEPTSVPAGTDADPIAAKIATLGGRPAPVETQAPEKARSAEIRAAEIRAAASRALEANRDEIKKRLRAERAREHRRLAAARRAQQARQAGLAQQQAASPFAQPPAAAVQQQAPNRYTRQSVRQSQAATPTP
jgi:hypothetical protein